MNPFRLLLIAGLLACVPGAGRSVPAAAAQAGNLAANGSFEKDADGDGVPDGWRAAGRREIQQHLTLAAGRSGGRAAKLVCTRFEGGTPDSHVMVCQVGVVSVRRGQWYRLAFQVKGEGMPQPVCDVSLAETRTWSATGISANFPVHATWRRVERTFQATRDVPARASRLQFWFRGTGTLYLDDVVLEPVDMRVRYHPAISTRGVRNFVPNSSFECGAAGWGSYGPDIRTWTGNVFRLAGDIDRRAARDGGSSLRMHIDKHHAPTYYFDYFDPVEEPVLTIVAGHEGWVPVTPGAPVVLSCYLKAARGDTPALLLVHESNGRDRRKRVRAGKTWRRYTFTVKPSAGFIWVGAGVDLRNSALDEATLWLDAVQLEFGDKPSDYTARSAVESFISTPAAGNVFTAADQGLTVDIAACNRTDKPVELRGKLLIKDFFDAEAAAVTTSISLEAGTTARRRLQGLLAGRKGFFRVSWEPENGAVPFALSLRAALIDACASEESPFGMNHAYGWDFVLELGKMAGLTWMRDWSVKWLTVQPRQGPFDFSRTDPQVRRVTGSGLNLLMLFPFPSTPWSSSGEMERIREVVGESRARGPRAISACPPKDDRLFRNYIAGSVRHYRKDVRYYEILNEPLYTTYAVPARFGYGIGDYVRLLRLAYRTIKDEQPDAVVLGGIGTWPDSAWVKKFIEAGGLKSCDVMDIHLYPATVSPELYARDLVAVRRAMRERGELRPMWLTELGLYADDDPFRTPGPIGDSAMSRSNWSSERAASEALVQSAAAFLASGVDKIFFHAGVTGPLNGATGAGIFFEYGGAPRKMFAALNVLASRLGPRPEAIEPPVVTSLLCAYLFETAGGALAVVWAAGDALVRLDLPAGVEAADIMGNALKDPQLEVSTTPVYLEGSGAAPIERAIRGACAARGRRSR